MGASINFLRQNGFNKLLHLQCLAHNLHRVATVLRKEYKRLDDLILGVKGFFRNAPTRKDIFREMAAYFGVRKLPPFPCFTRWGTWISSAEYFSKANNMNALYHTVVYIKEQTIPEARRNNASATYTELMRFLHLESLLNLNGEGEEIRSLAQDVNENFKCIPWAINEMQAKYMDATKAFMIINEVERCIANANKIEVITKMEDVIRNNVGFNIIRNYLQDGIIGIDDELSRWSPEERDLLKQIPFSSATIERMFSVYKSMMRDNRKAFVFENFRMAVICKCALNSVSFCLSIPTFC